MTTVTRTCYALLNGAWSDITAYVMTTHAEWGMSDNSPTTFLADPGEWRFDLKNAGSIFSPDHPSALSGWGKGVLVKDVFTFDGGSYVRFRGFVDDIEIDPGTLGPRRAHIVALEWMEYSARHPIVNPGVEVDQAPEDVLNTVLELMSIRPQNTDFDEGIYTFPTAFDTVTSKTKAYNEFAKVVNSETGHIYQRHDQSDGETLVFENAHARNGQRTLTPVSVPLDNLGHLLLESGEDLLLEDGVSLLLLNSAITQGLDFDSTMMTASLDYGNNLVNRFTVYVVPRKLDASPVVLFDLNEPVTIGSGQTYTIKGNWANPDGGLPINAQDVITPEITTDYLANTQIDGGGSDISSSLAVSPWTPGTEGFTAGLTNNNGSTMYVTRFSPRGTGIYQYNQLEHTETNTASINEFEVHSETLTQKYQNTTYGGTLYAQRIVEDEKQPRTRLNSISLCANISNKNMMAFLVLDVGDIVSIQEDQTGLNKYFYIQGVSYEVLGGTIIMFKWIVKETLTVASGLSMLAVELNSTATTDRVDFGRIPYLESQNKRTVSMWIYPTSNPATSKVILLQGGTTLGITTANLQAFWFENQTGTTGTWTTPTNSITLNAWNNVIFTRDTSTDGTQDPIIYINGSAQTLTETSTPTGTPAFDSNPLYIGNAYSLAFPYYGKIKDVRIYDRIVDSTEATAIYNSGSPSSTVGALDFKFQAFAVLTTEYANYVDATLNFTMKVRDVMGQIIGTPNGSVIGRAP